MLSDSTRSWILHSRTSIFFTGFRASGPSGLSWATTPLATARASRTGLLAEDPPSWLDPQLHLAVDYRFNDQHDLRGRPAVPPDPHGLSGSLLWKANRATRVDSWSPGHATVHGLITRWVPGNNCLVATKLDVLRDLVLQFLRHEAAYFNWEHRGRPSNDDLADWLWAEHTFEHLRG